MCGARNLGEALRRIAEGAAMIRTKGEAGSGNIVEAVRHIRTIVKEMKQLTVLGKEELVHEAKNLQAPLELVEWVASTASCRCPISRRAASPRRPMRAGDATGRGGGVRGLGHLQVRGSRGARQCHRARRPRISTTRRSCSKPAATLGDAMPGLDVSKMPESELLQTRGW